VGFFIVMAVDGRGKLSEAMAIFSVVYLLLLPLILVGTLEYNLFCLSQEMSPLGEQISVPALRIRFEPY